ncbi:MAG: HmuY family protein, partial [Nitrospirae bacterium]|nr:HmuY family protein [Nitrospirota bacterium]
AWSALTRVRTWVVAGVVLLSAGGIYLLERNRESVEWTGLSYPPRSAGGIAEAKITVDARSKEKWQYVRFSAGGVVGVAGSVLPDWDVAFRRFQVVTNSGATNPAGQAGVRDLGPLPFESIEEAPEKGYLVDARSGDRIQTENPALKRWYEYDYAVHRLKPKPNVYVVRTADGRYAKVRILSYYGPEKEAGFVTIRFTVTPTGSRRFPES